jgi:hypothetical protein
MDLGLSEIEMKVNFLKSKNLIEICMETEFKKFPQGNVDERLRGGAWAPARLPEGNVYDNTQGRAASKSGRFCDPGQIYSLA